MDKLPTGSKILDKMLDGGYENGIITTVYGPAGSGKTNLCILVAINTSRLGKKVIYVDTENNFSVERFRQICNSINLDHLKIINNMAFFRPNNFEEQNKIFEKLKDSVNEKVGIVIVDSIAMLYRLEMGKTEDFYDVNAELGRQISFLKNIASKKNIPVLVTNQVYADFDDKDKVNLVGGDLLKYGSKCLIELQATPSGNRLCLIRKHRSIPEESQIVFKIVEGGIIGTKEGKGFKLF